MFISPVLDFNWWSDLVVSDRQQPLGEDLLVSLCGHLLSGLGEHLHEVHEHPGRASGQAPLGEHLLSSLGQRTLGKHLLGG
jgi:hypothetical protein